MILGYSPGTFILIYRWFSTETCSWCWRNPQYVLYSYLYNSMCNTYRYLLYNKATATEINQVYKSLALAHVTFSVRWQLWEFPKMAPWVPLDPKNGGWWSAPPNVQGVDPFKRWCPNLTVLWHLGWWNFYGVVLPRDRMLYKSFLNIAILWNVLCPRKPVLLLKQPPREGRLDLVDSGGMIAWHQKWKILLTTEMLPEPFTKNP